MATVKDKLYFNFDGISCKTYNLMNVNVNDNGMLQENFGGNRTITETKVKGSDTPIFENVDEEPLEFTLNLAFTSDNWTDADIDNIVVWLFQDYYKPLYFEDDPNKIYYCLVNGQSSLVHNALKQGYVTVTMRCKSSKAYSPTQLTQSYDLSASTATYNVSLPNNGHVVVYPEISFVKVGAGKITFTKDGQIFEIDNLLDGENIYINCEREIIETDAVGVYHYSDVIGDYFDMALNRGNNTIGIDGTCKNLQFRYQFKYKF